jgi:anti-sigma B factor antagonist
MDDQVPPLATAARPIVVTMPAEIDNGNAGQVSARLSAAVSSGSAVVIADLTGTTFCSTAGIQALVRASGRAAGRGAALRLVVFPSGHVHRVLSICGLDGILACYSELGAAMAGAAPVTW